ncbi:hypothetical protein [Bosea sp. CS1GBMeth4]|uniref:hypothetical protein n=1 Tax=Bosea sp. CS1GBMeth4 TaxID=1892849 RepID=UPI001646FC64|nr:hypothetical protein [Bosea sp. CS1GBMeth4]
MTNLPCYNLETRLGSFAATVALDRSGELIDLLAFEAPEDMVKAVTVSLVSHAPSLASGADIGWLQGDALLDKAAIRAGERLVLGLRREAVMRAVANHRAQADVDGDASLEIAFSTIVETASGTRASPRRILKVAALAGASQPEWRIDPVEIDLDSLQAGKLLAIGQIAIDIPRDIVLEGRRGLMVEASCFGIGAQHLSLSVAAPMDHSVSLRRFPDAGSATSRHLIWLADAPALAGQEVRLDVTLGRDAVLDFVDETIQANPRAALQARLTARLGGWIGQDGAGHDPDGPAKPWSSALEARSVPIRSQNRGEVTLSIAGQHFACPLGGAAQFEIASGLNAEVDPDDETSIVRCDGLVIDLRRWPLTRTAPLTVEVSSRMGESEIAEPPTPFPLEIVREGDFGRRGRAVVPMQNLTATLSRAVRTGGANVLRGPITVSLAIRAGDEGGRAFAQASLPLRYSRRVHRLPICIDLGASATSIWSGAPRAAGRATEIKPLALGTWLAAHVDPRHGEAALQDAGAAPLIPSHVGLDSGNNLRADHAPHSLPDLSLIGSDRATVARRLKTFARRYDVSAPAPPPQPGLPEGGRRIDSLKHALMSGAVSLTLNDPVHRYDAAADRVVATNTVEIAPLVADVLDELVDLYVLRLGEDRLRIEDHAPPPVVPRILVSCPSGIGDEIASRYRAALELFAQRLERLFPGATSFPDAAVTVPEAVAAARYVASLPEVRAAVPDQSEALLVTLDIGGGTSDVALALLRRDGDRLSNTTLATFGLPVGGDLIDEALTEITALLIDRAMAGQEAHWQPAFAEASLGRAIQREDSSAIAGRSWLRRAVQQAKARLATRLGERARTSRTRYGWNADAADEAFELTLAEVRSDGEPAGLYVAQGEPKLAETTPRPGLALAIDGPDSSGTRRLVLRLSRAALETGAGEASQRLAEIGAVLGGMLPRLARAAGPNPTRRPAVIMVPTGRAALWPPVFEAIAAEADASRAAFPFEQPFSPAAMKKAVIAGAAILGIEGDMAGSAVQHRNPLGIAAMAVQMRDLGATGLRTEFAAERIHYLGYDIGSGARLHAEHDEAAPSLGGRANLGRRFQFVRTIPGLDPQGKTLARLRPLLGGQDPMVLLEGDSIVEAHREGLDGFGVCEILSEVLSPTSRKVTIVAANEGWEACWRIEHDRVSRIY